MTRLGDARARHRIILRHDRGGDAGATDSGFQLHFDDHTKPACVKGFSVFTGLTPYFIYARQNDVRANKSYGRRRKLGRYVASWNSYVPEAK